MANQTRRNRILRSCFRMDGKPKQKFETEEEAKYFARLRRARAYKCDSCDGWHLASR